MSSKIMLIFVITIAIISQCFAVHVFIFKGADYGSPSRRFSNFHPGSSRIIGIPSRPSHLPEAEPILPGHTLLRPGFSMLKSAIKFPHKDMENGAGVYGNIKNLGITYDGTNERVLYTGFRRFGETGLTDILPDGSRVFIVFSDRNKNLQGANNPRLDERVRIPKYKWSLEKIYPSFYKNSKYINGAVKQRFNKKYNQPSNDLEYKNLDLVRRQTGQTSNKSMNYNQVTLDSSSEIDVSSDDNENGNNNEPSHMSKSDWFWSMKDAYNHIKISPEAPHLKELRPVTQMPPVKTWWHFNEDDLDPQLNLIM